MNSNTRKQKSGVGVMILKDGTVLLGRRKGSHGEGEWAWPGGHAGVLNIPMINTGAHSI